MLAKKLGELLLSKHWTLATAESCTAGGVAYAVTQVPGSSAWFEGGFVTYSNAAKKSMLAVPKDILQTHGAVSEATVRAMSEGVLAHSEASIAIAISGIAGPDGGTHDKSVGLVWFAIAAEGMSTKAWQQVFSGDRIAVREQAITQSLEQLIKTLENLG